MDSSMEGEQHTKSCDTYSLNGEFGQAADSRLYGQVESHRLELSYSGTNQRIAAIEAELAALKQLLKQSCSALQDKDRELEQLRGDLRLQVERHSNNIDLIVRRHAEEQLLLEQDIYVLESIIRTEQRNRPRPAEPLAARAQERVEQAVRDRSVWLRSITPAQLEQGVRRLRRKWLESEAKASIQKKPRSSPLVLLYFPVGLLVHLLVLMPLSLCRKKRSADEE